MKQLVCIGCPRGCRVKIDEQTLEVTGNSCERGASYARDEITNPTRTLTSTVKINGAAIRRCPVRTDRAIAKSIVADCARALDSLELTAPVKMGDVIVENILNTGANVICTRSLEAV